MLTKASDMISGVINATITPQEREAHKATLDAQALEYLKAKFPNTNEEAFYTDYMGTKHNPSSTHAGFATRPFLTLRVHTAKGPRGLLSASRKACTVRNAS